MESKENPVLSAQPLPRGVTPWPTPDPFLFCAHHDDHYPIGNGSFGPRESLSGRNMGQDFAGKDGWNMYHGRSIPGFPQHPHRGFETVTVVRRGLLDHADSMGAAARYGEGDVQWLTAGAGIQHAEMFPLLHNDKENPLELFQVWLNLPQKNKLVPPHFSMLWAEKIPVRQFKDEHGRQVEVTVNAGRLGDAIPPAPPPNSWASQAESDVAIWTVRMAPGASWVLPPAAAGSNRTLYFFRGKQLTVADQSFDVRTRIDLLAEAEIPLVNGEAEAELLLLQGKPLGEPVAQQGPFVMNTQAELRQAFLDYQRTGFGGWPWPSSDPVHGAEPQRFARRPDGELEKPV